MQRTTRPLLNNLVWFAGSLLLAFFVWILATFQSDPIVQQRFRESVPIRLTPDTGLLITSPAGGTRGATPIIRAPRSVLDLLRSEEVEVWADLRGLGPGEHAVELQARLARQQTTVVDIVPSQVRVTLEEASERQIPLRAIVTVPPPAGYAYEEPVFDVNLNQVLLSGPASRVDEVVAAQVELDLSQQRNPLQTDLRLTPVNADGGTVMDVTLEPQNVRVIVTIRRRDDVREVAVRPNIDGQLPEGYVLNALTYDPQIVLLSGSAAQLTALPDTLSTASIDLTNRTASFEVSVPVELPDEDLLLLSGQNITVTVEISTLTASRQFDSVPVEILGLTAGFVADTAPDSVTVLITGPQPEVERLDTGDIRAVIDLNGLPVGNYTLTPSILVNQGQMGAISVSVLPAELDVEISRVTTTPTAGAGR